MDNYIGLLQAALDNPDDRRWLLGEREIIRAIMKHTQTRQWLFEQANQSQMPNPTLDLIVDMMRSSRLLWRSGAVAPEIYDEALSRTWVWFLEKFPSYNPEKASFVTWFNNRLGWKIQDVIREKADMYSKEIHSNDDDDEWIYPPAPQLDRYQQTIEEWIDVLQRDPRCRKCRMQNNPYINCQELLLKILRKLKSNQELSWDVITQEYQVNVTSLRRFCSKRCFRCFQELMSD